ncbi:preprotein translocase subunit SecG [Ferrovum sp.]|uniref:preprotein translocase subunit SecG n=1 Tax=Ferrovum sp. TaxID=2609467 RepID=UPI0026231602|nr:preprotein translocase subunit SecG [Ferrovum sp.]
METVVWIVHVGAALGIIGLVLMQHGKGADMGAAFGSGSAGGLFGASGASNFLSRSTAVLAAVFFCTSMLLTWYSGHGNKGVSVMNDASALKAPVVSTPANGVPTKSNEIPK